jgi:hypothetical protein
MTRRIQARAWRCCVNPHTTTQSTQSELGWSIKRRGLQDTLAVGINWARDSKGGSNLAEHDFG